MPTADAHFSTDGFEECSHSVEERGFPTTVSAQDGHDLSALEGGTQGRRQGSPPMTIDQ